jgi:hypothetical protein
MAIDFFRLANPLPQVRPQIFSALAAAEERRRQREQELADQQRAQGDRMAHARLQMGLTPEQMQNEKDRAARDHQYELEKMRAQQEGRTSNAGKSAVENVQKALATGNVDLARAVAADGGITDFRTEPYQPEAPPIPEQGEPTMGFAQPSYESQDIEPPKSGPAPAVPQDQLDAARASSERRVASFSKGGQRLQFDVGDSGPEGEAIKTLESYASGTNGDLAQIASANIGLVKSNSLKPSDALKRVQDAFFKLRGQDISSANAARAASGRNRDDARGDARLDAENEMKALGFGKATLEAAGYKNARSSYEQFTKMTDMALAGNGLLDQAVIGSWTKEAQGGVGVLTDADVDLFWNEAGSWADRNWNTINKVLTGKMMPERRAQALEAVKVLKGRAAANMAEARRRLRSGVGKSKNFSPYLDVIEGGLLGDAGPEEEEYLKKQAGPRSPASLPEAASSRRVEAAKAAADDFLSRKRK